MNTTKQTPQKVKMTLHLSKEAQDILFDFGYASSRTVGEFISQLIVDYHKARKNKVAPSPAETARELRAMADKLDPQP